MCACIFVYVGKICTYMWLYMFMHEQVDYECFLSNLLPFHLIEDIPY